MLEVKEARKLGRLACFLKDVESLFLKGSKVGKFPRRQVKKLKDYSFSFAVIKKDYPEMATLVYNCEQLRKELTDGKPYTPEKSAEIDRLFIVIQKELRKYGF